MCVLLIPSGIAFNHFERLRTSATSCAGECGVWGLCVELFDHFAVPLRLYEV